MGTLNTRQRIEALKQFVSDVSDSVGDLKAPGKSLDDIVYKRPKMYTAYYPSRPQKQDQPPGMALSPDDASAPSVLFMLTPSMAQSMEEERFDRYNNIHRPAEFGGKLGILMQFVIYDPGVRLPGFGGRYPDLIEDATEDGFYTLTDWMDVVIRALLTCDAIPGSDMYVLKDTIKYSPYIDGDYIADRRPFYYGQLAVTFGYYTANLPNYEKDILAALDG